MEYLQYLIFALILWFLLSRWLPVQGLEQLTPHEVSERLAQKQDHFFLDVREDHEYKRGHIQGFRNIPLSRLQDRLKDIPGDKVVVLTCQSGMRSRQAAKLLKKNGFKRLAHLKTGVMGWTGRLVK